MVLENRLVVSLKRALLVAVMVSLSWVGFGVANATSLIPAYCAEAPLTHYDHDPKHPLPSIDKKRMCKFNSASPINPTSLPSFSRSEEKGDIDYCIYINPNPYQIVTLECYVQIKNK